MIEKIFDSPNIYRIYVPLPENPLKNLNCYVVKTGDRDLVIDTGFNRKECLEELMKGLAEIKVDMEKAVLFLTHLHSDHIGLTEEIATENTTIYMNRLDYKYFVNTQKGLVWGWLEDRFIEAGFPENLLRKQAEVNPARVYAPKNCFQVTEIDDGFIFQLGEQEFECIHTPGHTPGHTCVYLKKEKILFSGDHILFDITPNITRWKGVPNSLEDYLKSLGKMKGMEINITFPAHRGNEGDVYARIDELLIHHEHRLNNMMEILKKRDGQTAYEVAAQMQWSMRGKDWSGFPAHQRWFAVGETLSHLDYLIEKGKLTVARENKVNIYRVTQ